MSGTSNIEERLTQLQGSKERPAPDHACPRIQRVAHHLRDRKHFTKHYTPKLVSMGPIHHGEPKLRPGEHYKQMWASTYILNKKITPKTLHEKVAGKIDYLKGLFGDDLFSNIFNNHNHGFASMDEMISWTLFVDGCALLHIFEHAKLEEPEKMNVKVDQLVLVMQDVLLMENQLPYPLLKLLWGDQEEGELIGIMIDYLECHHWATPKGHIKDKLKNQPKPFHLLDLQRNIILHDAGEGNPTPNNQTNGKSNGMVTYRNIKELRAAGIGMKSSKTRRPSDIKFSSGFLCSELTLPEIVVDDTTANTVLNLIAYEMCPDFQNEYGICAYISFLDSLIDHPDDVKELRSKQILLNSLGSDEEVANLFNTIGADLVDLGRYAHLRTQIDKHYKNRCKTWLALAYHTYFSNPWAIIAFHAAVLGLALTFIQTWYAIHPAK